AEALSGGGSSRDPASPQNPRATDRTPGMRSVTTRKPDSNSVRRMGMGESLVRGPVPALAVPGPPVAVATAPRVAVPPLPSGMLLDFHALGDRPLLPHPPPADPAHPVALLDPHLP